MYSCGNTEEIDVVVVAIVACGETIVARKEKQSFSCAARRSASAKREKSLYFFSSFVSISIVSPPKTVREGTSSGRKCDVTFLLFLQKYAKIGQTLKAPCQSLSAISGDFE